MYDRLLQALVDLGPHMYRVAQTLKRHDAMGRPAVGCDCPVAAYLKGKGFEYVFVDERSACTGWGAGNLVRVRLPPGVGAFVHAFDAGEFPELLLHA